MIFNFKEFDVHKRSKLCENLDIHPWFNENDEGRKIFGGKIFNFQQISPPHRTGTASGLEICNQNH